MCEVCASMGCSCVYVVCIRIYKIVDCMCACLHMSVEECCIKLWLSAIIAHVLCTPFWDLGLWGVVQLSIVHLHTHLSKVGVKMNKTHTHV